MPGCTHARPSTSPTIIYAGCPTVHSCPIPGSQPKSNGDLSADIHQLESALINCALQVETIKQCQENYHAKATKSAPRA
ncbi:Rz1-like lysis system protein LysC [Pectobacteriaceae bacterium CE90]|nr:Rz1-like lysis system protein LysC [Pectobacteriaceae bacterium CE90]